MHLCVFIHPQAELNEVLEDDDDVEEVQKPPSSNSTPRSTPSTPSGTTGLEACLAERIDMYQTAISNANAEGETSKARRYDRGLKVSQRLWADDVSPSSSTDL